MPTPVARPLAMPAAAALAFALAATPLASALGGMPARPVLPMRPLRAPLRGCSGQHLNSSSRCRGLCLGSSYVGLCLRRHANQEFGGPWEAHSTGTDSLIEAANPIEAPRHQEPINTSAAAQSLFDPAPSSQFGNFHGQYLWASAGSDENAAATSYHHQ